jgi:DNA-directed RNA polymerase subunit beta'
MPNLDPEAAFESLKGQVAATIRAQFPFEGAVRRLEIADVTFDEKSSTPEEQHHIDNLEEQFKARTTGMTWGVKARGRLRLVDKATGHLIEEATVTLANLPKITRRYSYIIDGQERQHDSVFRSKSRAYHRIASNGDIQARWNLAHGHGFDLTYDPVKGRMLMTIGDSNIPLYSVLHVLNIGDAAMERAWGPEVFRDNVKAAKAGDVDKIFSALRLRMADRSAGTPAQRAEKIREYFEHETEVLPDAMKEAFGKAYTTVNGENLLLSSGRLLDIQKGRSKEDPPPSELPDDRQALSAKYLATTEDFVIESLRHHEASLRKQVRDRIDKPEASITDIMSPNSYGRVVLAPFTHAQRPEQTNPLQFLSGYMRTTIRGKEFGGVGGEKINLDVEKELNPTHLGFIDPIQTPEGEDTGIALNLPLGISLSRAAPRLGMKSKASPGQEIRTKVYDKQARAMVLATPAELEHAVVAYPDQVRWVGPHPEPIAAEVVCYDEQRKTSKRPWVKVRYVLPSAKALLSFSANLIPFLQNNNGNRAMMAAKQQEQALSLVHREAPLVQVKTDGAGTFEHVVGSFVTHTAPVAGVVKLIEPGAIHLQTQTGMMKVPTYNHFPLNGGKNSLHSTAVVKVGQSVEKGALLADSNYTKGGALALGANLRVAYVPWKGLTFEDGIVVSESAARRMASDHMHALEVTVYASMIGATPGAKARWRDHATPARSTPEHIKNLDDRGIVQEGSIVHSGDVLVAVLSPRQTNESDQAAGRIHKSMVKQFRDASLVWDHDYSGKVVKVLVSEAMNRKHVTVHVTTEQPLVVGDKLAGRHGNKGIISRVVQDHEMPHTADGMPADVLLNPAGVPSRMNIGQVLETAASKIAEKTGKPYLVENFVPGVDYSAKVTQELKKHGLTDTEEMFDPVTKRSIGQIMVGKQYILKLHHQVEKKETARSMESGYTHTGEAPKGSGIPGGGQKMDMLTTYAMLAHGANHNLREAYTFKSDGDQHAVWAAVITGSPLPPPQPTRGMSHFQNYLRALGVNVEKKGDDYHLSPLTDLHLLGDTKRGYHGISNGEIKLPEKLSVARGARTVEEHGGLFDPKVTGGIQGKFWSHVALAERMPSPLFEPAIQTLTGLTKKQFDTMVGEKGYVDGTSGFHTIVERLAAIDVDKELKKAQAEVGKSGRATLNRSMKKVRYLEALKTSGLTPLEAYTNKYLPVLPPSVRRVSIGLDGTQVLDDRNPLYLAVGHANGILKAAKPSTPHEELQKSRASLYNSIRSLKLTGMTTSPGSGKPRHMQGLMELLSGKTEDHGAPKESFFQEGVLARRQDLSGRSTIVPEPALGLDQVGIPRQIAMEMYKPFVIRELVRGGKEPLDALRWATEKKDHPQVMGALERAVAERPVFLKRDPSLHKFSIMAFKPKIVDGSAVKIHPLVTGGFNADFDGDTMALYVPVSAEAVEEAHTMLPSKNLFSPTHFGLLPVPGQDSLLGIFQATKWGTEVHVPAGTTAERAMQMMHDGKLKPTDVITIDGKKTTAGRLSLAKLLPAEMQGGDKLLHDSTFRLNKDGVEEMLSKVAREHDKGFATTVDGWKDLGNHLSYLNGSSFAIHDFHDGTEMRDRILKPYAVKEKDLHATPMSPRKRDQEIVKLYKGAQAELKKVGKAKYDAGNNRVWEWAQSGARGNWNQFAQLTLAPVLVEDFARRTVPVPITKSFGEGLSVSEYWASMHGARKGTLDRAQGTREPGAVQKDIVNTTMGIQVTAEDCGSTEGKQMGVGHNDIVGRFLAHSVKIGTTDVPAGEIITPSLVSRARNAGVHEFVVRSPLFCKMGKGVCAKCYGHNERGGLHPVGTNLGVIAGQALSEPITQLAMKTFHTGGVSSSGQSSAVDSFKRVKQLFMVPEKLPDKAVLSTVGGTVGKVSADARGGFTIDIEGKAHRVVTGHLLEHVKPGAVVHRGDQISTGPIDPHELLEHTKSIGRTRNYITDAATEAYQGTVRQRNVEMVVRGMTNLTEVHNAPQGSPWHQGDLAPLSAVDEHNAHALEAGHEVVKHTPTLRAMTLVPLSGTEDWMARLNYQRLKDTYTEGAAQGWKSNIHEHPIPGLAHGAEFGLHPPKTRAPPPPSGAHR